MALTDKLTAIANAIRAKTGKSASMTLAEMPSEIASIPSGGITPTGSVTLTEENTYDVTDKATAVVDFSTTRANLAEAVTAKGVDTLPTSSFDTIATNIGLIEGGGGSVGVATGSFTVTGAFVTNLPKITHNLGTQKIIVIVYADPSQTFAPLYGYSAMYWVWTNVPKIVGAETMTVDYSAYNANLPDPVEISLSQDRSSTTGNGMTAGGHFRSPYSTHTSMWGVACNRPTQYNLPTIDDNSISLNMISDMDASTRLSPGVTYLWKVVALP